jgi:hypothetical protein
MKRRRMIQSVLGVSAASALPHPLIAQRSNPDSSHPPAPQDETPKLAASMPDTVGAAVPRFFDPLGFSALRRLGEILVPAHQNTPGAMEAEAAEFLDFLISQSPGDRQTLYRDGAARLNQEARSRYGKPFAQLSADATDAILAPLREPWTYQEPKDPFARFLRAAKADFLQATFNSRQWAAALSGRRGASGLNTYWFPIE